MKTALAQQTKVVASQHEVVPGAEVVLDDGVYVVAVSGGVDSVVLLDMLYKSNKRRSCRLVVAHLDHGMRPNSADDRKFVGALARRYGLPFTYETVALGHGASENDARQARYAFLRSVVSACSARAIVTAHHQDDWLETALFNMIRGSSYRGLVSLRSRDDLLRPLLRVNKSELVQYANANGLGWREDESNRDLRYSRNQIRAELIPRLGEHKRRALLQILEDTLQIVRNLNDSMHDLFGDVLTARVIERSLVAKLPHGVAREFVAQWLRQHDVGELDNQLLERLTIELKVARMNTQTDIKNGFYLKYDDSFCARLQR